MQIAQMRPTFENQHFIISGIRMSIVMIEESKYVSNLNAFTYRP